MCQIKTFENLITAYLYFPTKIRGVCYGGKFDLKCSRGPKNCIHYSNCPLWKCPLYRGFSMRVLPWFGRFHKKVSPITSCLLYSMSFIARFNCIKFSARNIRCFARSKFVTSLVHKKNFGLIWHVIYKLEFSFCQGRKDTSFELEWTPLLCLIIGGKGGPNCKFWEKTPQVHLIIIREWPKNSTRHFKKSW